MNERHRLLKFFIQFFILKEIFFKNKKLNKKLR